MEEPPSREINIKNLSPRARQNYNLAFQKAQRIMKGDPERIKPYIELAEIEKKTRKQTLSALLLISHLAGRRRFSDGNLTSIQLRAYQEAYEHPDYK